MRQIPQIDPVSESQKDSSAFLESLIASRAWDELWPWPGQCWLDVALTFESGTGP